MMTDQPPGKKPISMTGIVVAGFATAVFFLVLKVVSLTGAQSKVIPSVLSGVLESQ